MLFPVSTNVPPLQGTLLLVDTPPQGRAALFPVVVSKYSAPFHPFAYVVAHIDETTHQMETFGQGCPPVPVQRIESKQPMLALQTGVAVVECHIAALAAVELQGPKRSTFKPAQKNNNNVFKTRLVLSIFRKKSTLCVKNLPARAP